MSDDLLARIQALEAKVTQLYSLTGHAEPGAPAAGSSAKSSFPPEVVELALAGKKIEAIKALRDATGLGLADAKTVVDQIR